MSDQPEAKTGRIAQIRQAYTAIKSLDPRIGWWMLGSGLLTAAVVIGIGFALGGFWRFYGVVMGITAGLLAAIIVMNRRGNTAMYRAMEGQPGAAGATLTGLGKRGWYAAQEPVAIEGARGTRPSDMAGAAMVFRALGRPGVVLIGEGPEPRVTKLLKQEEKKVTRVAPGVPVHLWVVGEQEGQVPIKKVSGRLTRMRPVLTKEETSVVNKRLKSLGGMKPPNPKGLDPPPAPGVPVHLWVVGEQDGQVPIKKVSGRLTRMRPVLTKEETSVVNKRLKSLGGMKPPIPKGIDPTRARVDRKAMRGK